MSDEKIVGSAGPITTPYRYRYSFTARFIQADETIQRRYGEIKNHLLSYKGVKCKTAWGYESFRFGRDTFLKVKVRGKAVVLFMDLDAKNLDEKYHAKDLTKADGSIPPLASMFKVKSQRGVKFAKELVDLMMSHREAVQGEVPAEDYTVPYRTSYKLLNEGLIKVVYNQKALLVTELPAAVVEEVAAAIVMEDSQQDSTVVINKVTKNNTTVIINEVEENTTTTIINKSTSNTEEVEEVEEPADEPDDEEDEEEKNNYVNPFICWGSIGAELIAIFIIFFILIANH